MKENKQQRIVLFLGGVLFLMNFLGSNNLFHQVVHEDILISSVYAEDDEDENEDDDEEDDDNHTASTTSTTKEIKTIKTKPVYKTVYFTNVIATLDPIFTTDTDKDGIVDGLDPHPTVSEKEYFTDEDDDGIANAFDMYGGEDDYAYYEQDNDTNGNGILDSYESLGSL